MESEALRGIRWTLSSYGGTRVIGLISTLILARLLEPDDFGIVAFDSLIIVGFLQFSTLGLAASLIVRPNLPQRGLGTALTMLTGLHVASAVVLCIASPLVSRLLDDPQAGSVLIALSLNAVLATVTHFYGAVLQRELRFREVFLCEAASVVTVAVLSIGLALAGAGVWSLVGGFIGGAAAKSAMLLALAPYRVRLAWDREEARELVTAGRGFFLQGGLAFVEQNADYAVVGSLAGSGPLGLYSMAYRVSEVPYDGLVQPIAQATFPGFARMKSRAEPVRESFLQVLRLTALVGLPLGVIASGAAEPIVEAVLGQQWLGAIGPLHILGIWGSVRVVQGTIAWFLNGMDHASAVGVRYAAMLAVSLPLVVVAAHAEGAEGVAWVMLANVVAMSVIVAMVTRDVERVPLRLQWQAVRVSVAGAVVAWLATTAATAAGDGLPPALALVVSLGAGVFAYLVAVFVLDRRLLIDAIRQMRRITARRADTPRPRVDGGTATVRCSDDA